MGIKQARTSANDGKPSGEAISLPKPGKGAEMSVMSALLARRTERDIGSKKLSRQMLSNLLWAACGVNRGVGPFGTAGITAASASNSQEIEVYVALDSGCYRYDPEEHRLILVCAEDLRPLAIGKGQNGMGAEAPLRLIYVANLERFKTAGFQEPGLADTETQKAYYYADTGLIAGNVYLFAASQGLSAWFHNCDKAGLEEKLQFGKSRRILFGQTVGYTRS
jgi:hypothetical protein